MEADRFRLDRLAHLKEAGTEKKFWPTQCGFRSAIGTVDVVFVARRVIDEAWASKHGAVTLLVLDWAKAFDSVAPSDDVGSMLT